MAFACWKCHEDPSLMGRHHAISCIRIQGSAYMLVGAIEPSNPETKPNFIQVFFNSKNEEEAILRTTINSGIVNKNSKIEDVKKKHVEWLTSLHRWIRDNNPIYKVYEQVKNFKPGEEEQDVKLVFTSNVPMNVDGDPRTFIDPNESTGPVCISTEVGAIIDTRNSEDGQYKHDIVIKKIGEGVKSVDSQHRMKEPLMYPLLFPYGSQGFGWNVYKQQRESKRRDGSTYHKSVTGHQYLKRRLFRQDNEHDMYLRHGRLTQEWILSSYLQVEKNNLDFLRHNQDKLKAGQYKEVQAAMRTNQLGKAGVHVILPSSFKGSPRDNIQRYCDAMAVVRALGKPSYFITMTCNPKWKEIVDNLPNGLKAHECPDLVARVFQIKLKALLKDLTQKHVLGKHKGRTYVIEFQKRGLPHAHILMIMEEVDTPKRPEHYDCAVTAEFSEDPEVRKVQSEFMYHRCNKSCENDTGRGGDHHCSKGYPKSFREHTSDGNDSYPEYRRRPPTEDNTLTKKWGGPTYQKNTFVKDVGKDTEEVLDNSRLVPHNIFLLMKYRCHLNVEVCNSITAVKYLYKYVYKGHDKVMYGVKSQSEDHLDLPGDQVRGLPRDEIREFVEARYLSTSEAIWRTLEFPMGDLYPLVQRLNIHLEDEQQILFTSDPEETRETLDKSKMTQLTAFFMLCKEEKELFTDKRTGQLRIPPGTYRGSLGEKPVLHMLYREVPQYYTWVPRNTKKKINPHWKRRVQNRGKIIGRVRHVPPSMECKELFHFRLLLNTRKGPTSYEDLRTVVLENGKKKTCDTYHEAAFHMGLVQDDKEWEIAMEEASSIAMPRQIRSLFVIILTHGLPQNSNNLWEKYRDCMSEDFKHERTVGSRYNPSSNRDFTDEDYNHALLDIESQLQSFPKSHTTDYGLPATREPSVRSNPDRLVAEIREALNFDREDEKTKKEMYLSQFNEEQKQTYHEINESVMKEEGKCFYLDGAGGCGKTTVAKSLLHAARSRGDICIACASSGIASTLLPKGQTAHSAFKIPIEGLNKDSTCNVGGLSGRAELLRQVKFIVWDEVFMVHRHGFEAVVKTMQHLRENDKLLMGGCTLLILGDLRQTLPILPKASRTQIISACLTKSKLCWNHFKRITLTQNMRVLSVKSVEDRRELKTFCDYLIKMGDGTIKTDDTGAIKIPTRFLLPPNDPLGLLKWVYGDRPEPLPISGSCSPAKYKRILQKNIKYYSDKAILCPKNVDVDKLNEDILQMLPEGGNEYLSADSVPVGDVNSDEGLYVTTEFLNNINLSGLPPFKLTVKVGCVMMLLRNLNPKKGLCNGTRILITSMTKRLLRGMILTGSHQNTLCIIPRVTLYPSNNPFPFKFGRRQFPVRHAYVMTINKSQGQTFRRTGLLLPDSCFSHGQLYVAFSRCGYPPNDRDHTGLKIVVYDTKIQGRKKSDGGVRTNDTEGTTTQNIVLKEIFSL